MATAAPSWTGLSSFASDWLSQVRLFASDVSSNDDDLEVHSNTCSKTLEVNSQDEKAEAPHWHGSLRHSRSGPDRHSSAGFK
ncbi:hypothetical protein E4U58_001330, partial [Claviceps cyperi]